MQKFRSPSSLLSPKLSNSVSFKCGVRGNIHEGTIQWLGTGLGMEDSRIRSLAGTAGEVSSPKKSPRAHLHVVGMLRFMS